MPDPGGNLAPISVLKEAIKAVPAVKWALGIAGLAAAAAISTNFLFSDSVIAFVSIAIVLFLMGILVLFARIATLKKNESKTPALVLIWAMLIIFVGTAVCFFLSAFFDWPKPIQDLLHFGPDRAVRAAESPESSIKEDGPNRRGNSSPSTKTVDDSIKMPSASTAINPTGNSEHEDSSLNQQSENPHTASRVTEVAEQATFSPNVSGRLNLEEYCRQEYSLPLAISNGSEFSCGSTTASISDACLKWFGSKVYSIDSGTLSIQCDTSQTTSLPCPSGKALCRGNRSYCCPITDTEKLFAGGGR